MHGTTFEDYVYSKERAPFCCCSSTTMNDEDFASISPSKANSLWSLYNICNDHEHVVTRLHAYEKLGSAKVEN